MTHKEDNRRRQDDHCRLDTSVVEQNSYTWGARLLYWGRNKMSAPSIKQFGESKVGPLGLRVRALWNANGWKLSDAEFLYLAGAFAYRRLYI